MLKRTPVLRLALLFALGHRCATFHGLCSSAFMPDQVPVNPADGAVVAAVGALDNVNPTPPAPADTADGNNVQNLNLQFLQPRLLLKRLAFFLSLYSLSSRVIRAWRYFSFRVCVTSFSFRVCVTSLIFASM